MGRWTCPKCGMTIMRTSWIRICPVCGEHGTGIPMDSPGATQRVVLTGYKGEERIKVIAALRDITGWNLAKTKTLVDNCPMPLDVTDDQINQLLTAGATIEFTNSVLQTNDQDQVASSASEKTLAVNNFEKAKARMRKKAFDWAAAERCRLGCKAEPFTLKLSSDNMVMDPPGCIVSIFYDDTTEEALIREDWLEEMGIQYHLLVNFEELKKVAPKSTEHMLENAIKIYQYFDGVHFGTARYMGKKWPSKDSDGVDDEDTRRGAEATTESTNDVHQADEEDASVSLAQEVITNVLDLEKGKASLRRKAYDWAIAEQRQNDIVVKPLNLKLSSDNLFTDPPGRIISIFYDDTTGKALYRQDWHDNTRITEFKHNLLLNFEEVKRVAPRSTEHMLENAIKIHQYFEALRSGRIRDMGQIWPFVNIDGTDDEKEKRDEENDKMPEFHYEKQESGIVITKYLTNDIKSVIVPANIEGAPVVSIGENCFFDHTEVEEIHFPDTLISIGDSAFAMCKRIQKLIIPDSVLEIGPYAFRDCTGLRTVILPRHLKVLKHGVFAFCNLADVNMELPRELETIETHAFYSAGLFDLLIPRSVKEIQPNAFEHLGPNPITSLPHDRSWYPRWPLGEIVRDDAGSTGVVKNVRRIQDDGVCNILTIVFEDKTEERFYPCGMDGLSFDTEISRKTLEEDMVADPENEDLYRDWLNGLI